MKEENTNKGNTFTTIKTSYARAALVLLALNFCLTGYVIANMAEITQEAMETQQGIAPVEQLNTQD